MCTSLAVCVPYVASLHIVSAKPAWVMRHGAACAALLCLHNAMEGGLSSWSSSISVHNEILRRRPDLARVLAGPWFMDRKARPLRTDQIMLGPAHQYAQIAAQPGRCGRANST